VAEPTEINAITLVVVDMDASVRFYNWLGFDTVYGGPDAAFTSLKIGENFVNLQHTGVAPGIGWGRVIFHVESPDELHAIAASHGYTSETEPADAPWGERYFHILDPDGHELSFARRL
jgi:catechol 2,3-dioxygenase-like lactoylglutathione lyase family enzyme